jgi:hypothetical protein
MHFEERVDCSMCIHWTMLHCKVADHHYPHDGHLCARFEQDFTIEDGEYDEPNDANAQ